MNLKNSEDNVPKPASVCILKFTFVTFVTWDFDLEKMNYKETNSESDFIYRPFKNYTGIQVLLLRSTQSVKPPEQYTLFTTYTKDFVYIR